ncbi:hypothetical protein PV726_40195 [Streptomyces europaeiscabiei]|uniref:hypothetical protein n=1 Tax=Streptomyces europaeiscabiei TaxID=146819 RepID=UPI0029B48111|nr:hypothetical protein [Streptomyces europaeiscabiei]MDX3696416.1 hypothetical protein [Streptomyces europaeiscabiei]
MDASAGAAALEEARFDARQASRPEDLADDVRGPAELAEWERIAQLLADAAPDPVYDPDTDDVVQAELAADAAASAAREAELQETARIAARADELQALRELGTRSRPSPARATKPPGTNSPGGPGSYVQKDDDAWLAHALAAPRGLRGSRRPRGRRRSAADAAAHPRRTAHRTRAPRAGRRRRPAAGPEATGDLAAFLTRARSEQS